MTLSKVRGVHGGLPALGDCISSVFLSCVASGIFLLLTAPWELFSARPCRLTSCTHS